MRHRRIYQGQQLLIGVGHIEVDLTWDIDDLNEFSGATQYLPSNLKILAGSAVELLLIIVWAGISYNAKYLALQVVLIHGKEIL